MDKLELIFRRKNGVFLKKGNSVLPDEYVGTILKNLSSYGYTLSREVIENVKTLSIDEVEVFYNDLMRVIKEVIGFRSNSKPMYLNFPKEVMDKDYSELYINAIVHYLTYGEYIPKSIEEERFPHINKKELKIIQLYNEKEALSILSNLLSSPVSLSEIDKFDVLSILDNFENAIKHIPSEIPFKENLIFTTVALKERDYEIENISKLYKTATDVLRLAAHLSDGDVTLAKPCKFKSFKMSDRRLLLGLLENAGNIEEDMVRYKNQWIRLGEIIHPNKYPKYKKVNASFHKLRSGVKIETFNSKLEKAFKDENVNEIITLLSCRPGEYARNIDRLLRLNDSNKVIYGFGSVVDKVAPNVLLQLIQHLKGRTLSSDVRVFYPKADRFKIYGIENNLVPLNKDTCDKVINICKDELKVRYSNKESLGNVFIDKSLSEVVTPLQQRTASKSLNGLPRGSKLPIDENIKVIRAFTHWRNIDGGRVDIDLSASFLDENFKSIEELYYGTIRNRHLQACHSGDITNAPNGAFEYVDFDIDSALKSGVRYVAISVNSYTSENFCDIPECFYGFMEVDRPQSGEIFEPTRVINKVDLTSESTMCVTAIYDLAERKMITVDAPINIDGGSCNNIVNNKTKVELMLQNIVNSNKPRLYDLFEIHANARGNVVEDVLVADTIFTLNKENTLKFLESNEIDTSNKTIITAFDVDVILGEYL